MSDWWGITLGFWCGGVLGVVVHRWWVGRQIARCADRIESVSRGLIRDAEELAKQA